jgi:hypothetical protein
VADEGGVPSRAQTGTRIGTRTWPVERARQAWGAAWPQAEFALPARLREWALVEVGAGRLLPWFAVAFGTGIVLYFTAEREPIWWASSALTGVAAIAAELLRRRPLGFVLALGVCAICAGFAVATSKTALIDIRCCAIPVLWPKRHKNFDGIPTNFRRCDSEQPGLRATRRQRQRISRRMIERLSVYRHPEAAAKRPSKDARPGPSPFDARCACTSG